MFESSNVLLLGQLAPRALDVVPPAQWYITGGVCAGVLAALAAYAYFTRSGIIARATTKEALRQPIFLLLLAIGILVLVLNTFLPFFSLGEDVKMVKDCGLATMLICGLLLAVWTSSISIADEIEGKTAMTLLSKPINRRQFIVGKYFGIIQSVLWLLVPMIAAFLALIYYKVGYDAREASKDLPGFDERMNEVLQILPGLVLIVLEVSILTAISVAISTRVPMIVNMVVCFAIFVVGHLTPILVRVATESRALEMVQFMAQLIATVLPSLQIFDMQTSVAKGTPVPPVYLGVTAAYCAAYCTMAIFLAFILFEDRDLA